MIHFQGCLLDYLISPLPPLTSFLRLATNMPAASCDCRLRG